MVTGRQRDRTLPRAFRMTSFKKLSMEECCVLLIKESFDAVGCE